LGLGCLETLSLKCAIKSTTFKQLIGFKFLFQFVKESKGC